MKTRLWCIACLMALAAGSVAATTYTVTTDNQGFKNVLAWLADDDNDGFLNFGSLDRELKFVFAECP